MLFVGLILILWCRTERGGLKKGGQMGGGPVGGAVRHTFIKFAVLYGCDL